MVLELNRVNVSIDAIPILHDVSLRVRAGEIYGLVGPTGSGKSTTVAAAIGLLNPWSGEVKLQGRDLTKAGASARKNVGVVFQQNGFCDWMTAGNYLSFYARLRGFQPTRDQLLGWLTSVGLSSAAASRIGTLPHGTHQRLALARALVGEPRLILLDEPTEGMAPDDRCEFGDILMMLAKSGTAVLLCSRFLYDIERLCTRIGFIVAGQTVAEGAANELLARQDGKRCFRLRLAGPIPYDYVGRCPVSVDDHEGEWTLVSIPPDEKPDEIWRELMFCGWPITEIVSATQGLDELYRQVTRASEKPRRGST